jgi:hypothetical protein
MAPWIRSVQHIPVRIVRHDHARAVAGDPSRRFRGDANAVAEYRLAMLARSFAAVLWRARSSSCSSFSDVAMRVIARTLA